MVVSRKERRLRASGWGLEAEGEEEGRRKGKVELDSKLNSVSPSVDSTEWASL